MYKFILISKMMSSKAFLSFPAEMQSAKIDVEIELGSKAMAT
jgi:hypothetical protein